MTPLSRRSPALRSLLLSLALLSAACATGTAPVAGQVATVDGRAVAYELAGAGPAVVLESGLGDGAEPWRQVVASASARATVFAYDRAGYGGSALATTPRDGPRLVEELRRTLETVALPPPYVLVGHSLGGQLVLLYARLHPEQVAGVVLVEGRPAAFTERCLSTLGEAACAPPASVVAGLPPAMRAEYDALAATAAALQAAPAFPPVPVVVLRRAQGSEGAAFEALWDTMQAEQAAELGGTLRTVPGTGHYIQRDAPAAVADAIAEVLAARP